ncbi:hypothetical protein QYF36_012312 [Acer negundo]|nr:hypothetical protein QYF36_012312 [Acer negundo]
MEIVEPSLLLEERTGNSSDDTSARCRRGKGRDRIEESLVGVMRIGVVCSMESPAERMEMINVVAKLYAVWENFLVSAAYSHFDTPIPHQKTKRNTKITGS